MAEHASLHEIEKRALDLLKQSKVDSVNGVKDLLEFDIGHYPEITRRISVVLGVEGGRAEDASITSRRQGVEIRIILILKSLRSGDETSRRSESLPILEAIIKILNYQRLGLNITPIKVSSFKYRTTLQDIQKGFILWELKMNTSLNYCEPDEGEDAPDLETIFAEYFLDGDVEGEVVASDITTNLQD